jgi:6-phosphofructo-2-kinase
MTRSRVSPDGRIAERDVASKLVIVMVGLPARGKSYITKKIQRYLSWQQHNSKIFNVGERRRLAAGVDTGPDGNSSELLPFYFEKLGTCPSSMPGAIDRPDQGAPILLNGNDPRFHEDPTPIDLSQTSSHKISGIEAMDQSAEFFDPSNQKASRMREQVALSTLDELLNYLLLQGGSVGILDATNSTIERRKLLYKRIKDREPKLGILFIESICEDKHVRIHVIFYVLMPNMRKKILEANMRLKLSGPDYRNKDPQTSLEDFKKRVEAYKSAYIPLGAYEEDNHMQYIQVLAPLVRETLLTRADD